MTHLRGIYEFLSKELKKSKRTKWVEEELEVLTNPSTYRIEPNEAWNRLKTRTTSGKFLAMARELAKFREIHAQTKNIPRNRVYKDDALLELASTKPQSVSDLGRSRLLLREARKGDIANGILKAVAAGMACDPKDYPEVDKSRMKLQVNPALADLLRVLLKAKSESAGVAQKLVATAADLDGIAGGLRDAQALRGWRKEVFGDEALLLCEGKIALSADGSDVRIIHL